MTPPSTPAASRPPSDAAAERDLTIRVRIFDPATLTASADRLFTEHWGTADPTATQAEQVYTYLRYGPLTPIDYGFEIVYVR